MAQIKLILALKGRARKGKPGKHNTAMKARAGKGSQHGSLLPGSGPFPEGQSGKMGQKSEFNFLLPTTITSEYSEQA